MRVVEELSDPSETPTHDLLAKLFAGSAMERKIDVNRRRFRVEVIEDLKSSGDWDGYMVIDMKRALYRIDNWNWFEGSFGGFYLNTSTTRLIQKKLPKEDVKS